MKRITNETMAMTWKVSTLAAIAMALSACGGGGGGGGATYNVAQHDALAQQFITAAAVQGYQLTLVKQDTQQQGFIVVQDALGNLNAVDVDLWSPGQNIVNFLGGQCVAGSNTCYQGLTNNGNGTYQIWVASGYTQSSGYWNSVFTGSYDQFGNPIYTNQWVDTSTFVDTSSFVVFQLSTPGAKDLSKLSAFKQEFEVSESAKKINASFGLSLDRSTQVAKLAIQLKNTPKESLTESDYNSISKALIGASMDELDAAINAKNSGDASGVDALINKAASANNVGPEQIRSVLNGIVGSSN